MNTAVIGAGAMGTMCAAHLARRGTSRVALWGHTTARIDDIARDRENRRLLPGIPLPDELLVTGDIRSAVDGAQCLVVAIPTRFLRATLTSLVPQIPRGVPVVSVVKGIENATFSRPSEVILETLGPRPVAVLSGPCHAEEAGRGLPATLVAASADIAWAEAVQSWFNSDCLRVYVNDDTTGVELAGAIKNVMAIAAGVSDGLKYGDNAKSAVITRGLVEMTRFGVALGGKSSTFVGLAGIGDLITTCVSPHGRNRHVGEQLGRGKSLAEIAAAMPGEAEGVNTCASVRDIALARGIEMPIVEEVYQVLFHGKSPTEATHSLLNRPPGHE